MDSVIGLIIGALHIFLLNMVLSGDNIGVIALATKDLPEDLAKRASRVGVMAAIGLRIFFACIITYIMMIEWLPIKLVGGLLLVKITWDFIKPQHEEQADEQAEGAKAVKDYWAAVRSIIIADISMSLDNVLAIGGAANGRIELIIFGLVLSIPIILFGSQFVANLMKKHAIVIYIGGAILIHTAFGMIFEDKLIIQYIPHLVGIAVPFIISALTLAYGMYLIRSMPEKVKA